MVAQFSRSNFPAEGSVCESGRGSANTPLGRGKCRLRFLAVGAGMALSSGGVVGVVAGGAAGVAGASAGVGAVELAGVVGGAELERVCVCV